MVVTSEIKRAIEYYHAINRSLKERRSQYKAIIAFSGDVVWEGQTVNETTLMVFQVQKLKRHSKRSLSIFDCCR